MRKAILAVVLLVVVVWMALWLGSVVMSRATGHGAAHAWPLGLGSVDDVPLRHPPRTMSAGAAQLIALATPLGIDLTPRSMNPAQPPAARPLEFVRGQLSAWVEDQIRLPTPEIEPLPSESGEYLAGRAADITAVTTLLLSGERIVWPEDLNDPGFPLPNLGGLMQLQRVLIGRALDRARVADHGAWDDLRAAWRLVRPLTERHEIVATLVALGGARQVAAAARKLPLPEPQWLSEMLAFDFRRPLIAAYQAEAWRLRHRVYAETTIDAPESALGSFARRAVDAAMAPYTRVATSDIAGRWRRVAVDFAATRACHFDARELSDRYPLARWNFIGREMATPNLDSAWQRVLAFTPHTEATVRALALRRGEAPRPESACPDGRWIYGSDGRSFRFSLDMPDGPRPIPLEFSLDAGGSE